MYLICPLKTTRFMRGRIETKGMPRNLVKAMQMSSSQVGKLFTAPIVHAVSLLVLGKATFKEAKRAARGSSKCPLLGAAFQLRCTLRIFPSTAPFGPSMGLSLSGLETRVCTHRRKDRRPLPGWKIRS